MADTSQPHSSRCPAWLREGGLYLIVSGVVTVLKYLLLLFLPRAFAFLPMRDFGWPGIEMTLLGETFRWNIFGYDTAHGGLPYLCAYMAAMVLGECVNFPLQRKYVFRAKGHLARQVLLYALAFIVITCLVNSINCIWVAWRRSSCRIGCTRSARSSSTAQFPRWCFSSSTNAFSHRHKNGGCPSRAVPFLYGVSSVLTTF